MRNCPICYAAGTDHDRAQRHEVFTLEGLRHAAPAYWLMGRATARERDGEDPRDAYHGALRDWADQCRLTPPAGVHSC